MPGFLVKANLVEWNAKMRQRLILVNPRWDLERNVQFTSKKRDVRAASREDPTPSLTKVAKWAQDLAINTDASVTNYGELRKLHMEEGHIRTGLAIILMLRNHKVSAIILVGKVKPDTAASRASYDDKAATTSWQTFLSSSSVVKNINKTFLDICAALVIHIIKGPKWAAFSDNERADSANRVNLFKAATNDKWVVAACYQPWAHILNLTWIFGPQPLDATEKPLQEAVRTWLHAKVYLDMGLMYDVLDNKLPVSNAAPLKINFESEVYGRWKLMLVEKALSESHKKTNFRYIPMQEQATKKPRVAKKHLNITYETYFIAELFGPNASPITE